MLGQQFYHETMRKVVVAFGTIFNNINIVRTNNSGEVIQSMKVPLAYGPKQKFLTRLREDPNLNKKVALTLPRIGFEISGIAYDPSRKLNSIQKFKKTNDSGSGKTMSSQFMPVPYNMDFELVVMAKNSDDALQIVEQILPFFNPQYTLTITPFPSEHPSFKEDIPITLTGVGFADDFEGELGARRTIIYTIDFEMRTQYYGPIPTSKIIRQSVAKIFANKIGFVDSAIGLTVDSDVRLQTIQIDPNPINTIGDADSDFGFTTTIFGQESDGGFGS